MAESEAHIVMLKGVRLNEFNNGLYFPETEIASKGKHKGKPRFKWGAKFIFPKKDTPEGAAMLKAVMAAMKAAKRVTWGDDADEIKIKSGDTPLGDGDHEDVTFSAYEGAHFISASKTVYGPKGGSEADIPKRPFRVIGPRKTKADDGSMRFPDVRSGDEGAPYSGCYVNLKVEFWGQKKDGEVGNSNRLNATILAVQFARDGDSFGGGGTRVNVDDEFEEEGDDDFGEDDVGTTSSKSSASDDLDI